jgi:hypothetical protein
MNLYKTTLLTLTFDFEMGQEIDCSLLKSLTHFQEDTPLVLKESSHLEVLDNHPNQYGQRSRIHRILEKILDKV